MYTIGALMTEIDIATKVSLSKPCGTLLVIAHSLDSLLHVKCTATVDVFCNLADWMSRQQVMQKRQRGRSTNTDLIIKCKILYNIRKQAAHLFWSKTFLITLIWFFCFKALRKSWGISHVLREKPSPTSIQCCRGNPAAQLSEFHLHLNLH